MESVNQMNNHTHFDMIDISFIPYCHTPIMSLMMKYTGLIAFLPACLTLVLIVVRLEQFTSEPFGSAWISRIVSDFFTIAISLIARCISVFISSERPYGSMCASPLIFTRYGMPSQEVVYMSSLIVNVYYRSMESQKSSRFPYPWVLLLMAYLVMHYLSYFSTLTQILVSVCIGYIPTTILHISINRGWIEIDAIGECLSVRNIVFHWRQSNRVISGER